MSVRKTPLGDYLKDFRVNRKLAKKDMAELCEMTASSYFAIEAGWHKNRVKPALLKKLSTGLGVDYERLVELEHRRPKFSGPGGRSNRKRRKAKGEIATAKLTAKRAPKREFSRNERLECVQVLKSAARDTSMWGKMSAVDREMFEQALQELV